jgi:hypothetical protein
MKKRVIIGIVIIALLSVGAYLFENISTKQGMKSAKIIKITQSESGKTVAFISSDILKQLMKQNLNKNYDEDPLGPSLSLTMHAAGVSDFKKVEIKGKDKSIVLNKEDIKDDLILFLQSNGSTNLCNKGSSTNSLVNQVTEISIKN